ncbi:TPA: AbrB/MazE/SpoVT family DNA-binding domain-containing protein [Salmonella enterica]
MIVTIPRELATGLGWAVGVELSVEKKGDGVSLTATKHRPRGRLTVTQLLEQIDEKEIAELNSAVDGWADGKQGNEAW